MERAMVRLSHNTLLNLKALGLKRAQIAWVLKVCTKTVQR